MYNNFVSPFEADANSDVDGPATDYIDFDLVDLKEDLDDIATILKLSDIAKDKVSFTVSQVSVLQGGGGGGGGAEVCEKTVQCIVLCIH